MYGVGEWLTVNGQRSTVNVSPQTMINSLLLFGFASNRLPILALPYKLLIFLLRVTSFQL